MKLLLIGCFLLCALVCPALHAQTRPGEQRSIERPLILAVGHLNPDSWPDTLLGRQERENYIPTAVHWGRRVPSGDTARFIGDPRVTRLRVPTWPNFGCSVSHELLSTDTLTDLVIYMWGTEAKKNPKTKEVEEKQLFRIVALFGQRALDDVPEIDLEGIDSAQMQPTQARPFFARQLHLGRDYTDPALREQSGRPSYEVPRIELEELRPEEKKETSAALISIAPNPAADIIRIMSAGLPAGSYTVSILTLEGTRAASLPWTVPAGAASLEINLTQLASGYYMIHVEGIGAPAATYPFVTIH